MLNTKSEDLKPKGVNEIVSMPVYGAREEFNNVYSKLYHVKNEGVMLELSQLLSVPEKNTPLAEIIRLREKKSFKSARRAFKEWQFKKVPEILGEKSEKNINLATDEFIHMLNRYEEEIQKGKFKKRKIVITSILALGALFSAAIGETQTAIAFASGAAPNLFSLREAASPIWKDIRDKDFEAAGIIYEGNKILNKI